MLTFDEISVELYQTGRAQTLIDPREIKRIYDRAAKKLRNNPEAKLLLQALNPQKDSAADCFDSIRTHFENVKRSSFDW